MSDLVNLKNELSHFSMPDLLNIYAIFSQRLTHVVDVQWKLASIFIPLSLSGVIFLNEDQRSVIFVGTFSILLIWIWYMFERRNQRSILRQQTMLAAIESIVAEHDQAMFGRGFSIPDRFRAKKIGHTMLFRIIVYSITVAWIITIVFSLVATP
ncbi:MAG: hypothetical protein KDE59_19655 [Anaerolineales bacterium]|nr:hypothetical protein [Anaerolineales bacterium]